VVTPNFPFGLQQPLLRSAYPAQTQTEQKYLCMSIMYVPSLRDLSLSDHPEMHRMYAQEQKEAPSLETTLIHPSYMAVI